MFFKGSRIFSLQTTWNRIAYKQRKKKRTENSFNLGKQAEPSEINKKIHQKKKVNSDHLETRIPVTAAAVKIRSGGIPFIKPHRDQKSVKNNPKLCG
jgi:hypothetical protein